MYLPYTCANDAPDLDQREDAADIGPDHPVLIDPEFRLDRLDTRRFAVHAAVFTAQASFSCTKS
jgi:hypothetical protein